MLQIIFNKAQGRFRTVTKTSYKGSNGILLLYSVEDKSSYDFIANVIKSIEANKKEEMVIILVGNKSHLESRMISEEEGKKLAEKYGYPFFECSTENKSDVNEVFEYMTREIYKRIKEGKMKEPLIRIKKETGKEKKGCANKFISVVRGEFF